MNILNAKHTICLYGNTGCVSGRICFCICELSLGTTYGMMHVDFRLILLQPNLNAFSWLFQLTSRTVSALLCFAFLKILSGFLFIIHLLNTFRMTLEKCPFLLCHTAAVSPSKTLNTCHSNRTPLGTTSAICERACSDDISLPSTTYYSKCDTDCNKMCDFFFFSRNKTVLG